MGNLSITYVDISSIKPYARNARNHPRKQVNLIAAAMQEFGFTNPIITDENGEIIAGHGRLQAAKQLGLTTSRQSRLATSARRKSGLLG